jgi:uncharacterized protein (TIGR02284 family)
MEDISRTIDALTSMIAINNKRASTYKSLAEQAQRRELSTMLHQLAEQAKRFSRGLSTWRSAYGGFGVTDQTASSGAWFHVRALLGLSGGKDVISKCEELEQEAVRIYKSAVAKAFMPPATMTDVQEHCREFEKALSRLRSFREPSGVNRKTGGQRVTDNF